MIGSSDTPYGSICGLLICFAFIYIFVDEVSSGYEHNILQIIKLQKHVEIGTKISH